jgi:hypothetical protein
MAPPTARTRRRCVPMLGPKSLMQQNSLAWTWTDIRLRHLMPSASMVNLSDGGGLYMMVVPTGRRYWRYSYGFAEKKDDRLRRKSRRPARFGEGAARRSAAPARRRRGIGAEETRAAKSAEPQSYPDAAQVPPMAQVHRPRPDVQWLKAVKIGRLAVRNCRSKTDARSFVG